ncbi:hypothetical protein NKH18_00205 [Streptomyces sp. M10(2022)]
MAIASCNMTTTDTIAALALAIAVVAAVAAIGSWRAARHANGTAQTLSRIEQQRLHADLTRTSAARSWPTRPAPPPCCGSTSKARPACCPTAPSRSPRPCATTTRTGAMDLTSQAPRLPKRSAHTSGAMEVQRGRPRRHRPHGRPAAAGDRRVDALRPHPTTPPSWSASNADAWHRDYANEPVRLSITARSKGSEWTVPLEVPVTIEAAS